ncbi:protein phosphatase 1, regulatory (inhibitor) subunit 14Aa [Boleophthalmus pectinirostris]|uniref:protein phosphatase 1, regulatory (inhibitor) subunit 14Aa n=1 Tax=Boleophthalmus pectinirostris TaxID=150288 RepID=UPI000A1C36EC|nr:protein phosphatase 1, regulatory (inhibitor) subunit 14Aa [Boleophthalmus pectinirostris]
MAADRCGSPPLDHGTGGDQAPEFDPEFDELHGGNIPKRHARVTVKYNRKELQRRLDVEKWIDECLDQLYSGQESDMPEEVNIDELIEMPNDEERVKKLQEVFQKCPKNTESFIRELVEKLEGMHKQEELQTLGIEHPVISHGHYRHEPYHFNHPHQRGPNKTL